MEEEGDDDTERAADREQRRPDEAAIQSYEDSDWRVPNPKKYIDHVEDGFPVIKADDLDSNQLEMLLAFVEEVAWSISTKWQAIIVKGTFSELIRDLDTDEARYAPHRPALRIPVDWQEAEVDEIPV